ncbi:hypothetical protein D3C72_2503370 [compost metagenome]
MQALELQGGLLAQQCQGFVQCVFIEAERRGLAAHHQTAVRCLGQLQVEPQQHRGT